MRNHSAYQTVDRRVPPGIMVAIFALLAILLPGELSGQILEEHDLDDPPVDRAADEAKSADLAAAEEMAIDQTNEFRKKHRLGTLEVNDRLTETARYFAEFMARTGKYGHTADGKRPSERAEDHDYEYCIVAENIAYQFRSTGFTADELAEEFVAGWRNSPEHRKNMLDPDMQEIGLAIARTEDSPTYFAVQMFGRPKSAAINFRVRNESDTEVEYTVSRRNSDRTFPLPPQMQRTHQRCRSATIEFSQFGTQVEVEDGAQYVIGRSSDGQLELTSRKDPATSGN